MLKLVPRLLRDVERSEWPGRRGARCNRGPTEWPLQDPSFSLNISLRVQSSPTYRVVKFLSRFALIDVGFKKVRHQVVL